MQGIIVCPACDLVHRSDSPPIHGTRCSRCHGLLQRSTRGDIETAVALAASAAVLLLISNLYPLVSIDFNGSSRAATLTGAAMSLYRQGYGTLAMLVFLTTIAAPLVQIAGLLYVLAPLTARRRARAHEGVFRLLTRVREWTFAEVFMLGALVALVKLAAFATVVPGVALAAYGLLMLALVALTHLASPEQFWRWVEQSRA